ncbi:UDP-glucose 4-epimerase [Candidatus Terasakiella magnetica]|nr:UDP-glucose 4-epimerase [Candidatus Terasakiella magnetica]
MTVLVTGATGFVGAAACRTLKAAGLEPVAALRSARPGLEGRVVGEIGPDTAWDTALDGIDVVLHLAARAHVMNETEGDPLALFRRINRDGALALAEAAAAKGVRRLVFVSTIKVNGEATPADRPFRAEDAPAPIDAYGIAKAEAEAGLRAIAARTGLELVVIRPPLVHGPGVKGNFSSLIKVLRRGIPLPLGAITANRRSLIGLDNLCDALNLCLTHPQAPGRTFLVKDGDDVSTTGLIRLLAQGLGRPARLLPVPVALLRLAGRLTGKNAAVERLTGSLVVDDGPLRALGWTPSVTLEDGLRRMAGPPA